MTARERATIQRFLNTLEKDMNLYEYISLMSRTITILAQDFIATHDALWVEPKDKPDDDNAT